MGWDIEEFQTFLIGQASKPIQAKTGLTLKFTQILNVYKKERKEFCLEIRPTKVTFQGLE